MGVRPITRSPVDGSFLSVLRRTVQDRPERREENMAIQRKRRRELFPKSTTESPRMLSLREEMNRLFDNFLYGFGQRSSPSREVAWGRDFRPNVDVAETDGEVKVSAELPGMTEDDIDVEVDEEKVTISGEKMQQTEEEEGGRYWRESSYGSFLRQIPLPSSIEVDNARASFKNGVLQVTLPKLEEEKTSRRKIEVSSE
ncbi:Hsp20 family protein [Candidatus Fermentibacteria bacterium]|nr:Hsp20 family protein [Candidatus Fermentibacteria bacterium]